MPRLIENNIENEKKGSKTEPHRDYPATHEFSSHHSENKAKVDNGRGKRRPGGDLRGAGPWKSSACPECEHEHAKKDVRGGSDPDPRPLSNRRTLSERGAEHRQATKPGRHKTPGHGDSSEAANY